MAPRQKTTPNPGKIGSSVTQNTKINAEPSRRRGQAVHSHTNCGAILGPASSLVCPTGIEPAHIRSERIALSTELRTDKGGVIPPRTNFLKNGPQLPKLRSDRHTAVKECDLGGTVRHLRTNNHALRLLAAKLSRLEVRNHNYRLAD